MTFAKTLILVPIIILMAACAPKTKKETTLSGAQGIWLKKSDAEELRSTQKVASLCEDIRKDPDAKITHTRFVKENGGTYLYNPDTGLQATFKIGVLKNSGEFKATESFKTAMNQANIRFTYAHGILTEHFLGLENMPSVSVDYVRTTDAELKMYFAAQDACKKK